MRICVIGAGIVGVTTAHALQQRAADVTLLEARSGPCQLASYANGAQLSFSFTDPLGSPALLRDLPRILLGRSPGIRLRHSAQFAYLRWAAQFLWHCLPANQRRNAQVLETYAKRASDLMADLLPDSDFTYYHRTAGKLVLLSEPPSTRQTQNLARKRADGMATDVLNRDEAERVEPALTRWRGEFSHALHSPDDAVADAHAFSQVLCARLAQNGAELCFDTNVERLRPDIDGITVVTNQAQRTFDAVVLCTGNTANELLAGVAPSVPVQPVTGYSITLPTTPFSTTTSITALAERVVFAPLANRLRVAGFADINARAQDVDDRIRHLTTVASNLAPDIAEFDTQDTAAWAGSRPMSPSSAPHVGATAVPGLYLNLGHGMLGWTLACATAEAVSLQICQFR